MIAGADRSSGNPEIFGRRLAAIFYKVELDSLIFVEGSESGSLDGRDVDEHILIAG